MKREQRRLAAILAADVVGYSRLMGRDESGTLARLKTHRTEHLQPALARHAGRLVKLAGDGALVEFSSAVDALSAAIEFQQAVAGANRDQPAHTAIVFRIGLHLGDLIVEGDDLYGDGVNVAARLEAEAPPGGIVVSRAVHEAVAGRLKAGFEELGNLVLKNIERPVPAFRVDWDAADWTGSMPSASSAGATATATDAPLSLPDRPSIAVLAFANMSGDPQQEYFADGVVEDIITALSRFKSLFVIARNSSFTYKGKAVDIKQVGRELGVRYVLEGSVRKAGSKVRITGQLIDSGSGAHLWADRFDGSLENVFELQDQVTTNVIGHIAPTLERAEIERLKSKPTASFDAYDHLLRGIAHLYVSSKEATAAALKHLYEAIRLDPQSATACGWASIAYTRRKQSRWMDDRQEENREGVRLGRKAIELGKDDAFALGAGGFALAFMGEDFDAGLAFIDRALILNPNLALAWHASGWVRNYIGEPETAFEHLALAMRLSPLDPHMAQLYLASAIAMRLAGRYADAITWANRALQESPDFLPAVLNLAAGSALDGRLDDARRAAARALEIDPTLSVSAFNTNLVYRRAEDREQMARALRLAGIPA